MSKENYNNYAYSLLHNSKIKSSLRKKKIKIKLIIIYLNKRKNHKYYCQFFYF